MSINRVSDTQSIVRCKFINQPREGNRSCTILYGPMTKFGCKNLTLHAKAIAINHSLAQINDANTSSADEVCFVVTASNGTKLAEIKTTLHGELLKYLD